MLRLEKALVIWILKSKNNYFKIEFILSLYGANINCELKQNGVGGLLTNGEYAFA